MASPEPANLDQASLEQFQTELIEAGFEPQPDNPTVWVGPIDDALKPLTEAKTMRIRFVDGWPFQHPRLDVAGLDKRHVGAQGEVCLWRSGAASGEWLTLAGYRNRIKKWADRAREGFHPEDFALDAHLSFGRIRAGLATVNLGQLRLDGKRGKHDLLSGTWKENTPLLEITPGNKGAIEGRWYYVGDVDTPPRDLNGIRELLSQSQRNNFDRRFKNVKKDGKTRLFLIAWDRELGREALVLIAHQREGDVVAEAIEVAPKDASILRLRAGPDTEELAKTTAIVFGVGALGSQVALLLAQAGLGKLVAVDGDRLRPGDIVRHAAHSWAIGETKVAALEFLIFSKAPWTTVKTVPSTTWDPDAIRSILARFDLVIETTGEVAFTNMLSVICAQEQAALVSAALYRGGALVRVRRQARNEDTLLYERFDDVRYPEIPPGDEPFVFEPGCSAPVNNASPVAVTAAAAITATVAIDALTRRYEHRDEAIDVLRALPDPPFDRLGRVAPSP